MIFYHYCSVGTFKEIIKSKVFWLSNLTESNDKQEVIRTFSHLWCAVKKRLFESDLEHEMAKEQIDILDTQFQLEIKCDVPFGTCFCTSGDALEQWKEYGDKTRGLCLGFEFDWFEGLCRKTPHPNSNILSSIGYDNVLYHNRELEDEFYKLCYESLKSHSLHAWFIEIRPTFKHYSSFIKNPTFHSESEARIVYYPLESHDRSNSLGISKLIIDPFPHYNLPWSKKSGENALREIGIGSNCNLSKTDIEVLIKNAGIANDIKYYNSISSYRIRE